MSPPFHAICTTTQFSIILRVHVGSVDEPSDKIGIAHLAEFVAVDTSSRGLWAELELLGSWSTAFLSLLFLTPHYLLENISFYSSF